MDQKHRWSIVHRRHYRKTKSQILSLLGNNCKFCGEDDIDVLQVDHKFNDGKKDRNKYTGLKFWRDCLNNPIQSRKRLQILCANCNMKKQRILEEFQYLERYGIIGF